MNADDPYTGEDVTRYPEWWQDLISHFSEYDLPPYRPPRFADDAIAVDVITQLEEAHDVDIRIRAFSPDVGDDWEVWIDNEPAWAIDRYRDGDGYTVYNMTSESFINRIVRYIDNQFE